MTHPTLTADSTYAILGAQTFTGAQTIAALTLITDTTDATSTTAAALVCNGGAAFAKKLYLGSELIINGAAAANARLHMEVAGVPFCYFGSYSGIIGAGSATDAVFTAWTGKSLFLGANAGAQIQVDTSGKLIVGTDPGGTDIVRIGGALTINSAIMIQTKTAFTNGAAAAAGTLANAPVAGNPTKWIPINDNGTTRYIPAW